MTKNINIAFYIPTSINLVGITEMVTKNKELLEQTKQDIIGMDLDYTHYLKIINTLKKEEKSTKDLVERLKNKEQEDIEVILKDWASNLRIFRLQMEKEQEAWKDIFLKKAEEEIKNKIKEIIIDIAKQTNHKLKFDYSSFVNDRVAINLGMFKGVRVEQYQEQLTSILNDMSYEHSYNQVLLKIMDDVDATNFLNLGMSFKVDYKTINFFNLKTEVENEKKRVELVNQKLIEEKERQELLKKKKEEEQKQKNKQEQEQGAEYECDYEGLIRNPDFILDNPDDENVVACVLKRKEIKQEQPIIKQQEPIIKDYYFENEVAIKEVNELLTSLTRFKIIEINGVKKRVIVGVIK
jgi:hypothetical protein